LIPQQRRQAFLYLSLALIGMILLGVSLPGLQFQDGLPIPGAEPVSIKAEAVESGSGGGTSLGWLQYVLAFGIVLLFVVLMTTLLKIISIKRIGLLIAALALLFIVFSQLPKLEPGEVAPISVNSSGLPTQSSEYLVAPIGKPPASLLDWVTAGVLLSCAVWIGWIALHAFQRTTKEDKLATETQAAVKAIADGQNLEDVIIRYYLKMESVIAQERGIERGQSVTPREFETYLENKGIPRKPILQLTTLFEKARYGNQSLNEKDEQDAVNCFLAIQEACHPEIAGIR